MIRTDGTFMATVDRAQANGGGEIVLATPSVHQMIV